MTVPNPRPLDEWFPEWRDSIIQGKHIDSPEDPRSRASWIRFLRNFSENSGSMSVLTKSYDTLRSTGVIDAEAALKRFLRLACSTWLLPRGLYSEPQVTPLSLRRRRLEALANQSRRVARLIEPEEMSLLIPPSERARFDRRFSKTEIFPRDVEDWYTDEEELAARNPPLSLSNLLQGFARALDAHVKWLSSRRQKRHTLVSDYVTSLAHYSSLELGQIDRALIVEVTRLISGTTITTHMLRKREKAGLLHNASTSDAPTKP